MPVDGSGGEKGRNLGLLSGHGARHMAEEQPQDGEESFRERAKNQKYQRKLPEVLASI